VLAEAAVPHRDFCRFKAGPRHDLECERGWNLSDVADEQKMHVHVAWRSLSDPANSVQQFWTALEFWNVVPTEAPRVVRGEAIRQILTE